MHSADDVDFMTYMKKQLTQSSLHCYCQDRWRYFTWEAKLMSCLVQQQYCWFVLPYLLSKSFIGEGVGPT